jgi:hypothetical protein
VRLVCLLLLSACIINGRNVLYLGDVNLRIKVEMSITLDANLNSSLDMAHIFGLN